MSFLLDTNVMSEVRKPRPNPGVQAWFRAATDAELYISVLVVGEIRQGIDRLRSRDPRQSEVYEAWLTRLRDSFGDRILPITHDVAEMWGRLNAPHPIAVVDGLMAATALVHRFTLVTRDVEPVSRTGASVLNPFE